jgi:AcrR family transcriptional regulator
MATLTRDRIIGAAVAIADRDGIDAVTLRRIATDLGVHVTSLYNHVATREAITDGIVELLLDEAKLPVEPVDWETWVRRFVAGISEVATTHPGAIAALQRRPAQGVRAAGTFEIALAAFRQAGFEAGDAYNAVKATALTALSLGLEQALSVTGQALETAVDALPAADFPQIRLVSSGRGDPEAAWSFSLETLVLGLRAQLSNSAHTG